MHVLITGLRRLHRDERGMPEETMNNILIFALVALPLLGLLIYFGDDIVKKSKEAYSKITANGVQSQ